jgi:hypothetical protein
MKMLSVRLPERLHRQLTATARRQKVKQSALVRAALESYLAGPNGAMPGSLYELCKDLIGGVESGIPDLATNPKYMEDFGR